MWLADLFLPAREDRFLSLMYKHADILTRVAHEFRRYVTEGSQLLSDDIGRLEKEGDDCLTELTKALRDAFITPIDRQDIYNLAEAIDDMIDYLNNAAREISIFKVASTDHMRAIAATLDEAATVVAAGVQCLKSDHTKAWESGRQAEHAENVVESRYRMALAELFNGDDMHEIFKLREVYRHLSNSADRVALIGRIIGKIVIKST